MTLTEYLEDNRHEAATWPGGGATWRMLHLFVRGVDVASFGGDAREALLNCYAVLRNLAQTAPDAELRAEAERYVARVVIALRAIFGDEPA